MYGSGLFFSEKGSGAFFNRMFGRRMMRHRRPPRRCVRVRAEWQDPGEGSPEDSREGEGPWVIRGRQRWRGSSCFPLLLPFPTPVPLLLPPPSPSTSSRLPPSPLTDREASDALTLSIARAPRREGCRRALL